MKFYLNTRVPICYSTGWSPCSRSPVLEQRLHGPQSLKYLLSGPLSKKCESRTEIPALPASPAFLTVPLGSHCS